MSVTSTTSTPPALLAKQGQGEASPLPTLPAPIALPVISRYSEFYTSIPPRSTFKAILIKIKDYFTFLIQQTFGKIIDLVKPSYALKYTERLTGDHMQIYVQKFNKNTHRAIFMDTIIMLEENGSDWNKPHDSMRPFFTRMLENFSDQFLNKATVTEPGQLRMELKNSDKSLLAMMVNVNQKHWTTIHFDFHANKIYYLDSKGPSKQGKETNELITKRLQQALAWITKLDPSEKWEILYPEKSNPSALGKAVQHDNWNCGSLIFQFTSELGATNATPNIVTTLHTITDRSFAEMERRIEARRRHIMYVVNTHLKETFS